MQSLRAKTALEGTDVEAIKSAMEALQQASYKLAEVAYSENAQQGGTQAPLVQRVLQVHSSKQTMTPSKLTLK